MNKIKSGQLLFLLLWLATLLTFGFSHDPGGLDVDSCNYGVVAKEILRTNQWLRIYDPVYGGIFYYHFPLCIWATALIFKLLGASAFSAKLFSMFSMLVLVATVFYFGKALKNKWLGFFAALSLILTNHVLRLALQCRMDIPVTLFITMAMLGFFLAQKYSRKYYLVFGIFTSLAIMSKDVFGLAPLAIGFIYLIWRRRWRDLFSLYFLGGLVLTFAPVLLWLWLDKWSLFNLWYNWNFLHLLKSPSFKIPWYYYIVSLLEKYFYFLFFAIYGGYLVLRQAYKEKKFEACVLVIWAVIFPLAFSFGRQKLHYFILPLYPAAALLTGFAFERIFKEKVRVNIARGFRLLLIIFTIVLICFPLNLRSKRFSEIVKLSSFLDQVLKQLPEYEFISYKQDSAAVLFYSQQLSRIESFNDKPALEQGLAQKSLKPRIILISQRNFPEIEPLLSQEFRPILQSGDKVILADKNYPEKAIVLP